MVLRRWLQGSLRELSTTVARVLAKDQLASLESGRKWQTLRGGWQAQIETAH